MRKRKVLGVIAGVLGLAILTVAGISIYHHMRLRSTIRRMEQAGLCNTVSVGERSLNILRAGNENSSHKIVVITGWGDGGEAYWGWRGFTEPFEQDNEFIFVDRAGYGLSDDNTDGATVAGTVEDYRTALQNSGIDGPYILMAHSLGGLYSSYWVSAYPEEIEGVIIFDGTVPVCDETAALYSTDNLSHTQRLSLNAFINSMNLLCRTGFIRFIGTGYEDYINDLPAEDIDYATDMLMRTMESQASVDELWGIIDSSMQNETWNHLAASDVPKIYIDASDLNSTDEEIIEMYGAENPLSTVTIPELRPLYEASGEVTDDMIVEAVRAYDQREYEDTLAYAELIGNCEVVSIPGDHLIFLDRTEDVQTVVSDFLSRIS